MKNWKKFPDLDTLQMSLGIPPVNTGNKRFLTGPSGIVTDDMEGLHARQDEAGKLHLVSGVEFQHFFYRGQVEETLPCVPTLGRIATLKGRLLAMCRAVAFEEALEAHPFIKKAQQAGFHVDIAGLAQHYGLPTDMLDISGSFAVACFFATSRWDTVSSCYLPVGDDAELGVIYRVSSCVLRERQSNVFHLLGWQPLPRPEQQRAYAIRLMKGQDFASELFGTECAYFKQNAAISRRIWKEFDEGRALFPGDPAEQQSVRARRLNAFTAVQLATAWSRVEAWECTSYSTDQRRQVEVSNGITVSTNKVLTWDDLQVESREEQLNQMIQAVNARARYRLASYL